MAVDIIIDPLTGQIYWNDSQSTAQSIAISGNGSDLIKVVGYSLGYTAAPSGTITTGAATTAVTGSGTAFTTQLAQGAILYTAQGTSIGTVSTITNDISLSLTTNASGSYTAISFRITPSTGTDRLVFSDSATPIYPATTGANLGTSSYRWSLYASAGDFTNTSTTVPNLVVDKSGIGSTESAGLQFVNTTLATSGAQYQFPSWLEFKGKVWNTTVTAASNDARMRIGMAVNPGASPQTEFVLASSIDTGTASWYYPLTINSTTNDSVAYFNNSLVSIGKLLTLGTTSSYALELYNYSLATSGETVHYSPGFDQNASAWNTSTATSNIVRFRSEVQPTSGASVAGTLVWKSAVATSYSATPTFTDRFKIGSDGTVTIPGSLTLGSASGALYAASGAVSVGTLSIANGGTGSTTATSAINALLPSQTSNGGKYLTTDGTSASWATVAASPGGSSGQIQFNNSSSFGGAAAMVYSSATTTAHLTITSQAVGNTPLLLKGIASQSAKLFDVQNSSGTSLISVASVGSGVGAKFQIEGTSSNQDDLLLISNGGTMTIAGGYGGQRGLRTGFRTNGNNTADRYFWSIGRSYDGFGYFGFGCDESTGISFNVNSATEGFPLSAKRIEDATTNTVTDVLNIERSTSGTAAAGIGARISYRQEHAGGTVVNTIGLDGILSDAGSTTYVGALSIKTNDAGTTTLTERARFDNNAFSLYPLGASAGNTYELRFMELTANGSNYIGFKGPDSVATNYTYVWPSGAPSAGQLLSASAPSTTGVVTLSWATDQLGTSGGGITSLNGLSAASQSFANDTNVTISSLTSTHTLGWSGTLAVGRGGTGTSTAPTQYGVTYGLSTTALAYTAAGSTDQILKSGAGAAAPSFGSINLASSNAVGTSILGVGNGGTGLSSLTAGYIPYGAGASAFASTSSFYYDTSNSTLNATIIKSTNSLANEGGEIQLALPSSGSTLSTSVTIDVYQNRLRIFETGGTNRGAYIDLSAASAGVGSNLLSGSGGSGTVGSGTANQIAYYSGTTTTASAASMVYSTATTTTHLTITAQAVGNNPLKLIGTTSQTADLFTVATSGGTVFNISSTGIINTGTWNGTIVAVGYGGTGTSTAPTQWGVTYGLSSTALAYTAAGSTDQILKSGGGSGAPTWGAVNLSSTNAIAGTLPVGSGGTGSSTAPTQWGVIFATSTSQYASTGAGSTDAPLLARTTGAPAFAALPLGSSNAVAGILGVTNGGTGTSSFTVNTILISGATTTGAVTTATALAYSASNQHLTITAQGVATSPLRLVGATSQTADLFQIYSTSAGTVLGSVGAFGGATFTSLATSATTPATALVVTGAAHTALNTATEYSDVYFNLGQTKTFATGGIATLRTFRVAPATYAFSGASTVTNATTFQIDGAPTAGTNATLTEAAALRILTGTASGKGLVIRGSSSQTGNYIDVQNNSGTSLVTLGTTNINLGPHGASAGNTFELRFSELAASGSEYIAFKAPDAITTSYTYVWPSGAPSAGQLLSATAPSTTGVVTLSWATDQLGTSGGGITSLNSATGASQTFSNDTNVTITTNTGTNTHALGWQGSLAIGRGGIGTTSLTTSNAIVYYDSANTKLATLGTGATTTVLVGGGASAPSFAQVNLGTMVTGTLPLASGGLGTTTFTQYGILYGNAATSVLVTAAGSADQVLKSGAGSAAPSWGAISLGSSNAVAGILGLTNGGTATSSFATSNGFVYYDGSKLVTSGAATSGQLLLSGTTGTVAAWTTLSGDVTINGTGTTAIGANKVTNAMLRQSAGFSVIGKTDTGTGNVADITASSTDSVLRYNGTNVSFGAINLSSTNAVTGTLAVGAGGTGTGTAPTQWGVIFATSTSQYASTGAGSTDAPLLARTGAAPAFAALPLGSSNAVSGTLPVANGGTGTSSFAVNTILISGATTTGAVTTATALAYSASSQHLTITAQGAATSPLRLVGATSQTTDLFQIYSTSAGTVLGSVGAFGGATFTSLATSATTPATALVVTGAAHTALNTATEYSDVYFNLGQTKTFATGGIATLRTFRVAPATYAFSGASTVTNAATFQIDGAPTAGTNATLTEAAALRILTGTASGKGLVIRGTTSQTGNYIDVQNNSGTSLVTLGTTNINLGPHGASAGNTFELRFSELAAGGSEYIAFKAPDAISTSYTYVWPNGTPTAGQLLSASAPVGGVVTLSWATDQLGTSGGGITSLNSATGATQTFSNDTNVTITTNTGTNTHALGWQGSLAIGRGGIGTTSLTTSNAIVYYDSVNTKLATLGTGATTTVLVGGGASAPSFAQVNLTTMVTGTLPLGNGGLGTTTFTQYGILYGNAATSVLVTAAGSADQVLKSGAGSAAPSWGAISLGSSNAVSGILGLTNGGTATSSFATTNGLIYYTGSALATLAATVSGVLVTNGSGVPSVSTDIPTGVTIGGAYNYRAGGTDVALADGGTGQSTYTNGDILYYNSTSSTTALTKLGIAATSGYFLTSTGSAPQWSQTLGLNNGGTGLTAAGTGNYILGMNSGGSALEYKQLVNGSNITITHGAGTITIASSGVGSSAVPGGADTNVQYNSGGTTFAGTSYFAYNYTTALLTLTASTSIQTTSTAALELANNTAPSTSIANHYSPAVDFAGRFWSAGAGYYAKFRQELQTTAATPTHALVWKSSSTTSTTASFTNRMALDATKGLGLYAYSGAGAGTNASFFKSGSQTSDFNYTLPTSAPTTNQVLSVSTVSGSDIALTWATSGSGSGTVSTGTASQMAYYSGTTTTASAAGLVYSATGTHLTITAQGASTSPLKVVGAASQSASIFTVSTSGGDVLTVDSSGFTSITGLSDSGVTFQNSTTTSKKFKFDAASISAATTRTITIPDATTTMVGTDATQTLTNKTISGFVVNTSASVSAAGTTQGTATAITADYVVVTSATAGSATGVILPTAVAGREVMVVNRSSTPIKVYPATGASIDGAAANASTEVGVNQFHVFKASSATAWFMLAPHRPLYLTFCAGYTPAATGADSVVLRIPDSSADGTTVLNYTVRELFARVETTSAGTSTIQVEYSTATTAFSGTNLMSTALSVTGSGVYEFTSTAFSTTTLTSGTKLRLNFTALNATHANFFVQLLLEEA